MTLLTGCGSQPQEGNLIAEDPGELCVPRTADAPQQINITVLRNLEDSPVQLEGVALQRPRGLELVDAYLAPLDQWSSLVVGDEYDNGDGAWAHAIPAAGATLAGNTEMGLVLLLSPDAPAAATSGPVVVTYSRDGQEFVSGSNVSLTIARAGTTCG